MRIINNPQQFTNRVLKAGLINNLDSHHINNVNTKTTITPKHLKIKNFDVGNVVKEMANLNARLINQYKLKN